MTQIALNGFEELDGTFLTVEAVAKLYGVDERTVQYWVDKDWCSRHRKGEYKLEDVVPGVYRAQLDLINRKKGPDDNEISQLERREQLAKTQKVEIEVQRLNGELVSAEEIKQAADKQARTLREALENIPSRISATLSAESDEHKIKAIIATEINRALEELSN